MGTLCFITPGTNIEEKLCMFINLQEVLCTAVNSYLKIKIQFLKLLIAKFKRSQKSFYDFSISICCIFLYTKIKCGLKILLVYLFKRVYVSFKICSLH